MEEEFICEVLDLLNQAESNFIKSNCTESFKENYKIIFRCFHSIKGVSGMMDQESLQDHMHQLENQLTILENDTCLNEEQIDYFLKAIDHARSILNKNNELFFSYEDFYSKTVVKSTENKKKSIGLVFIIDDEIEICELLEYFLVDHNFEVRTFSHASQAQTELSKVTPDLILSDLTMPDITGIDLLKFINGLSIHIPFILISGNLTAEVIFDSFELGAAGFIDKPFEPNYVISQCLNAIVKGRAIRTMNKAIKHLRSHYVDFDQYLKANGKNSTRLQLQEDIKNIIEERSKLYKFRDLA